MVNEHHGEDDNGSVGGNYRSNQYGRNDYKIFLDLFLFEHNVENLCTTVCSSLLICQVPYTKRDIVALHPAYSYFSLFLSVRSVLFCSRMIRTVEYYTVQDEHLLYRTYVFFLSYLLFT